MSVTKRDYAIGSVGAVAGALVGAGAASLYYRRKVRKKRKVRRATVRKRSRVYRGNRKQRKPYTAGKRRDTSTRRIRYTKNNQPYIILKSGKARFIKKSSVRSSRKRKGGRY